MHMGPKNDSAKALYNIVLNKKMLLYEVYEQSDPVLAGCWDS